MPKDTDQILRNKADFKPLVQLHLATHSHSIGLLLDIKPPQDLATMDSLPLSLGHVDPTMKAEGVAVQMEGMLQLKIGKQRKTKHCVIKDGFLLWYKPSHSVVVTKCGFDTKPQGMLPLDRAVATVGYDSTGQTDGCAFTIRHADIPFVVLDFKTEDAFAVHHWFKAIQHGKKANIHNGKLGYEMIERITTKDSERDQEREKALEELKKRAAERKHEELQKMRVSQKLKAEGKLEKYVASLEQETRRDKETLKKLRMATAKRRKPKPSPNLGDVKKVQEDDIKGVHDALEMVQKLLIISIDMTLGGRTQEARSKGIAKKAKVKRAVTILKEFTEDVDGALNI